MSCINTSKGPCLGDTGQITVRARALAPIPATAASASLRQWPISAMAEAQTNTAQRGKRASSPGRSLHDLLQVKQEALAWNERHHRLASLGQISHQTSRNITSCSRKPLLGLKNRTSVTRKISSFKSLSGCQEWSHRNFFPLRLKPNKGQSY